MHYLRLIAAGVVFVFALTACTARDIDKSGTSEIRDTASSAVPETTDSVTEATSDEPLLTEEVSVTVTVSN